MCMLHLQDVFADKATERKILSLAIKCPSQGCDWTGELRNKEVNRLYMQPETINYILEDFNTEQVQTFFPAGS